MYLSEGDPLSPAILGARERLQTVQFSGRELRRWWVCERGGGVGGGVRVFRAASVGEWWGVGGRGGAGERVSRTS